MLQRRKLGNGKVEITFTMPALEGVDRLYLVGDFNDWSIVSHPLTRSGDGSWGITLPLEAKRSYEFRYFDNHGHWHNDWQADAYVPNHFGGDNSVVHTLAEAAAAKPAVPAEAPAPKRRAPARAAAAPKAAPKSAAKPAAKPAANPAAKPAAPRKKTAK